MTQTDTPQIEAIAENLGSIDAIAEAMQELGYPIGEINHEESSLITRIEVNDEMRYVILDISEDGSMLTIESQFAKIGDINDNDDAALTLLMKMISINSEIAPFATNIEEPTDETTLGDADESPITLISAVPLGDFSTGELEWHMTKLVGALALAINLKDAVLAA